MTSPEIANVLKKYVTSKPLRFGGPLSGNKQTRQNRKDFEELQALALKDMKAFNKKLNDMKAKQGDSHSAVRDVLAKAGLSRHITDNNKQTGETTMTEKMIDENGAGGSAAGRKFPHRLGKTGSYGRGHGVTGKPLMQSTKKTEASTIDLSGGIPFGASGDTSYAKTPKFSKATPGKKKAVTGNPHRESYKDKFNAQMKKSGIDSLDDLKTDADKKAFFKAVDKSHKAVGEDIGKYVKQIGFGLNKALGSKQLPPDVYRKKMHDKRLSTQKPMTYKGISAGKEEKINEIIPAVLAVPAAAAVVGTAAYKLGGAIYKKGKEIKKNLSKYGKGTSNPANGGLSASYESYKYHDTKPGSLQDSVMQMQVDEQKYVTIRVPEFSKLVETYLLKGGVIDTTSVDEDVDLDEEINALPLNEVRDFITTYNKHFLTNYKAEEFIVQVDEKVDSGAGIGGGETTKMSNFKQFAKTLWKNFKKPQPSGSMAPSAWIRDLITPINKK